jgi:hypothetical protein
MKALSSSLLLPVLPVALLAAAGCAHRQPKEVIVVAPVETVAVAPVETVAPGQVVVAETAGTASASDAGLETWASRHSEAAKALGAWVHNNPEAAARIFTYDSRKPGRSRELVRWAVRHAGEDISVFTSKHPDWGWFDHVVAEHRLGADQFLAWCRQYPTAAEELIKHPSGLRWVGDHLYASDWHPESG